MDCRLCNHTMSYSGGCNGSWECINSNCETNRTPAGKQNNQKERLPMETDESRQLDTEPEIDSRKLDTIDKSYKEFQAHDYLKGGSHQSYFRGGFTAGHKSRDEEISNKDATIATMERDAERMRKEIKLLESQAHFIEKPLQDEIEKLKDQLREAIKYKTMWQEIAGKTNLKELVKKAEMTDEAVGLIKSIDAEMVKLGITHVHFKTEDFLTKPQLNSKATKDCETCEGEGIARCNNPDHGFISAMSFHDIGRLGCPACGHDPDHRIKGEKCDDCNGTGKHQLNSEEGR